MTDTPGMAAWIASLTTEDVLGLLSAALNRRDWLALEGAMKLLAVKDPELAQTVYDTMLATAAAGGESGNA